MFFTAPGGVKAGFWRHASSGVVGAFLNNEGLRLRVRAVDFDHGAMIVCETKGCEYRPVMLPQSLQAALKRRQAVAHAV